MEFANYDEFWAALSRLYDSTLEMKGRIDGLNEAAARLVQATEALRQVADTHERRLDPR